MCTVTYGGPIKKYAQTTPSTDVVSSFLIFDFALLAFSSPIQGFTKIKWAYFFEKGSFFFNLKCCFKKIKLCSLMYGDETVKAGKLAKTIKNALHILKFYQIFQ
jgi:hypothetical protein